MEIDIVKYLEKLRKTLLRKNNLHKIELTREWVSKFTREAGVYALLEGELVVYAGESGCLRKRMGHLLVTQQHTVRRTVGAKYYSHMQGYEEASSRKPFPEKIERLVDRHITLKYKVAFLEVALGRKELEEYIVDKYFLQHQLNKRAKSKMLEGPSEKAKNQLRKSK